MSAEIATATWLRAQVLAATGIDPYDTEHEGWDAGYNEVIVYNVKAKPDLQFANGRRVWFAPSFMVKAIVRGNRPDRADELAELVDVALHRKLNQGVWGGYRIYSCLYDSTSVRYSTNDGLETYRHAGGGYIIRARRET